MPDLVVRSAGFSPVKGMRHLALPSIELDEVGPVGDRVWCMVDVAAQRVLRTVQHPTLVGVVAQVEGGELSMTLPSGESVAAAAHPSGETITCDYWGREVDLALTDGPHAGLVSDFLGKAVRLAAAPRGGVVFASPITIVGAASLAAIDAEAARFRATLVVETDDPWVEDTWLGTSFGIGDAEVRIGGPVPRCAVIDHHPETGVKDRRLLKELARTRPTNKAGEPMFGVYAEVVTPGVVRAGA
ncbi:uncharacterized protein YcbX [Nocardioides sp. BE266]|uniref:MOSC domain-containing protein n=1 Tax=Nocardioides sp. BE266 TaxID=2817725 RepID=UPI002857F8CC|nr:MOSC N-terminal beta barrel domain-containing protein [Nocardioides sp. BE266]MDR7252298.1 uncharacterized protein YcbX [Nocardioides sp. BE266]